MANPTSCPLPEDEYLVLVGQFAYLVAYVEGLLINDLPGHIAVVPSALNVGALAGLTTFQIGESLEANASAVRAPLVRDYYAAGGGWLKILAGRRNAMLHARPATVEGHQRLYRWRPATATKLAETHVIDVAWLAEAIELVTAALEDLSKLRPPRPTSIASDA